MQVLPFKASTDKLFNASLHIINIFGGTVLSTDT